MNQDYNTQYYYDSNLNKSFPSLGPHDQPSYIRVSDTINTSYIPQHSVFLPSPQKTRILEFSNPYDLDSHTEKLKKASPSPIKKEEYSYRYESPKEYDEIKYLEPRVTYRYVDAPQEDHKPSIQTHRDPPSPYDYRTYQPLEPYYTSKVSYSPPKVTETVKRAHFIDTKPKEVDISNRIIGKLDYLKEDISRMKHSLTPERKSYKPRIFEPSRTLDSPKLDLIPSSPPYIQKAENIKRSGNKAKFAPQKANTQPIRKSYSGNKIFDPLVVLQPPPDPATVLRSLESPKTYTQTYKPIRTPPRSPMTKDHVKRSSPEYVSYGKYPTSRDVVIPSKNPLIGESKLEVSTYPIRTVQTQIYEEKPLKSVHHTQVMFEEKRPTLERRATNDSGLDSVLCIDCEQYIRAGNANLHSMFCYKTIGERRVVQNNDVRTQLRNILHFLNDEMVRIKRKGGGGEGGFWEACEELKGCLKDIVECGREDEAHGMVRRLHLVNEKLERMGGVWAGEVRKLGLKAEEDVMN